VDGRTLRHEKSDESRVCLLCSLKDVGDALGVPLPTPRRRDASGVQRLRNLPAGTRARLLCLADDLSVQLVSSLNGCSRTQSARIRQTCRKNFNAELSEDQSIATVLWAINYLAFIHLASIRLWLRINESTPYLNTT
jgi:hypothetical protein